MKVRSDSWHYAVYDGWHERKHGMSRSEMVADIAAHGNAPKWFHRQLDLCHYCRVIAFFALPRWIVHGTPGSKLHHKPWPYLTGAIALSFFSWWISFDAIGLAKTIGFVLGMIAICAVLVALVALGIWLHEDKNVTYTRLKRATGENIFVQVAVAKKRKVCPLIEVVDDDDNDWKMTP